MDGLAAFAQEFDQEMATTRRLVERVPSDKAEWRPHPKSFPLGHLTQLVCRMPGWIANALSSDTLDLTTYPSYSFETTDTLLAEFDRHVADVRRALARATDESLAGTWSLTMGGRVLLQSTRGAIVRQNISHLSHHRGQLTVYLRLLDVPIPPIYGPTADERTF